MVRFHPQIEQQPRRSGRDSSPGRLTTVDWDEETDDVIPSSLAPPPHSSVNDEQWSETDGDDTDISYRHQPGIPR